MGDIASLCFAPPLACQKNALKGAFLAAGRFAELAVHFDEVKMMWEFKAPIQIKSKSDQKVVFRFGGGWEIRTPAAGLPTLTI